MQVATGLSTFAPRHPFPAEVCQRRSCIGRNSLRRIAIAAAPGEAKVDVSRVKAEIVRLAGDKYGLDKSEEEREVIRQKVAELEGLDSVWGNRYDGQQMAHRVHHFHRKLQCKLGPFIGKVRQIFPSDLPGKYFNNLELGPLTASLRGIYTKACLLPLPVQLLFIGLSLALFHGQRLVGIVLGFVVNAVKGLMNASGTSNS
eukprot:jgi/Botrbrau1/14115/Bobra.182_3s0058.1